MYLHMLLVEDDVGKVRLTAYAPRPALMLLDPILPKINDRGGNLSKLALPDALDCIVNNINDFWLRRGKARGSAIESQ
jgi:hypothetical protein